jgi:hypothetical protein
MWEKTDRWPNQVVETAGKEAALMALVEKQGFAKPEEIAAAVRFLASDEAQHITGTDPRWMRGLQSADPLAASGDTPYIDAQSVLVTGVSGDLTLCLEVGHRIEWQVQ